MKSTAYWFLWIIGLALNVTNALFMLFAGVFELMVCYADHGLASLRDKLSDREVEMFGRPGK